MRHNNHDPRSTEYKVQAIEELAERDAAPYRAKNEREGCYSHEDIAHLAEQHSRQFVNMGTAYADGETAATIDLYEMAFSAKVRRSGQ